MEKNRLLSMLGLARRAGKLSMGHDAALKSLFGGKAKIIIFAKDSSPRVRREFEITMNKNNINIPAFSADILISEIHFACGYKAGIITVNDDNFSKKIISLLNQ
ncbi:MAG: ribosomal L7Ae/L30e/S12e/Gadd45 family protein [Clostridiales bacterium]|nr:ribosomal L7Ae/L30e/S12e/Gadd45 family protein [Clostridiales bacterium]